MHFRQQQSNCNWKTIYCFFHAQFTQRNFAFLFFRRLCVKKWMNENSRLKNIFESFIEWEKINFLSPSDLAQYWWWAIFFVRRDVDLIRWKQQKKISRTFPRIFAFFLGKVIFHRAKFFLFRVAATETEHLTNCDRIQWQLTQFVNQFPLHALNILCGLATMVSRRDAREKSWAHVLASDK